MASPRSIRSLPRPVNLANPTLNSSRTVVTAVMPDSGKAATEAPMHPSEDTRAEVPVTVKEDEAVVDLADVGVVVAVTVVDAVDVDAVVSTREDPRHQSLLLHRRQHRPATSPQRLAKLDGSFFC